MNNLKPKTPRMHRSTIEKFGEYKMKIIQHLIEDDELTKLIGYSTPDALFRPSLSEEDRQALVYTRIYPFRFSTDILEEQSTFLTIGMNGFSPYDDRRRRSVNDYLSGQVLFHFFCHNQIMRTDSGTRQDLILSCIGRLFERNTDLGMGEFTLHNTGELWLHNNRFGGYTAGFTITDMR